MNFIILSSMKIIQKLCFIFRKFKYFLGSSRQPMPYWLCTYVEVVLKHNSFPYQQALQVHRQFFSSRLAFRRKQNNSICSTLDGSCDKRCLNLGNGATAAFLQQLSKSIFAFGLFSRQLILEVQIPVNIFNGPMYSRNSYLIC